MTSRRAWALCLGMILGTTAVAQPPADAERFPQAPPEMPGVVVSKSTSLMPTRPVAVVDPLPNHVKNAAMPQAPSVKSMPTPYSNVITATIAPASGSEVVATAPVAAPTAPATVPMNAPITASASACCNTNANASADSGECCTKFKEWLSYHSSARQTGKYPTPYHPPLQAWFDCSRKSFTGGSTGSCASGGCTGAESLFGHKHASNNPYGSAPVPPAPNAIEGVSFTPGGSPIAYPTTQIKPTK